MAWNEPMEPIYEGRSLASVSTMSLLGQLIRELRELATKEVELARAEIREAVRSQIRMAVGLAAAAVFGVLALGLLLAAGVLALANVMPVWLSTLVVGAIALGIALALASRAKAKRVGNPLERTRRSLKENVR